MVKWLVRIALGLVALVVVVVAGGAVYEQIARANAVSEFPPRGKLVDIGGRRIQLDCRGAGSPVVVFESGLDALGSLSWAAVHDDVAKTTRACAYSRAGLMWSDPSDHPFSSLNNAEDLHRALAVAGEKPPYVLVGHSLGGPYALAFTGRYGNDVAGLVFVDASHPDQRARLRAAVGKDIDPGNQIKIGAALAWTGLVRLIVAINPMFPPHAPDAIKSPADTFLPQALHAVLAENDALDATLATGKKSVHLGGRPLIVLTHGAAMPDTVLKSIGVTRAAANRMETTWLDLHNDEASWSSRSRHEVVAGASHYIQFDKPQAVVAAVHEVVSDVREENATQQGSKP
jgi:pimeloyl-ACP methyl ester carboxylesterase